MRINTNLTAMNTYTQYTKNNNKIASSVEKLSSGYSINSAADNAAGLAISEKMRAQIRGLEQASSNSQDAISLVQTAEGALGSATEILQRMREIAVQSSSDTNNDEIDRTALQDEFSQLQSELDDISSTTTFNKKNLLDGSLASSKKSVSNVDLGNSSLAVSIGNASAGDYNYSVSVKQETAAVEGKAPTDYSSVLGTTAKNYFTTTGTVTPGDEVSKSALLNGNYSLSAATNDDGSLTITAKGDNDQTFTATISAAELDALETASASASSPLTLEFSAEAEDAFTLSLGVKGFTNDDNGIDTLSAAIADTTVAVSGGVTAKDATYGVYASLTGGESVKLNTGDTSVTFSNGVTVAFNKLTASDLDTTAVTDASDYTALSSKASVDVSNAALSTSGSIDSLTVTVDDSDGVLAAGGYEIKTDSGDIVLTDAEGNEFSVTPTDLNLATGLSGATSASKTYTLTSTDGTKSVDITFDAVLTAGTGDLSIDDDTTLVADTVGSNTNYSGTAVTGGTMSFSNLKASDASKLEEGKVTFNVSAEDTDGYVTFTAEDSKGNTYTAKALASELVQEQDATAAPATPGTATTSSLKFTSDADGNAAFTIDLTTTATDISDAAVEFAGSADDEMTVSVDNIGHNYSKVFGDGKTGALTDKGSSSFSVTEAANQGLTFQVGANAGDELTVNLNNVSSQYLGISSSKVTTQEAASAAVSAVDDAINNVSSQRAYLGAIQNRLDYKISNLDTSSENLTAAESQIRDVDMAKEMTNFTNANILQQAATAMLAQANSLPQNVLSLIG